MGLRLEAIPTRGLPAKKLKKICRLSIIISGGVYQKNTKRDGFKQHPCLSNQMNRSLMSNSFGSVRIRKKLGKSRVLAKNQVFRGKTGFYLPLPVKTEVYSQTREISRVWRYIEILFLIPSAWRTHNFVGLFPKTWLFLQLWKKLGFSQLICFFLY